MFFAGSAVGAAAHGDTDVRPRHTRIIVTLGPDVMTEPSLRRFRARGVDFVRTNMSHSSLIDLERAIALAKTVGIPFMIDTEGAQVRTGVVSGETIHVPEDAPIDLRSQPIAGNGEAITIRPPEVVRQLIEGDLLHIDFDTLILRVSDTSRAAEGVVRARTLTSGTAGSNKAVVVDPVVRRRIELPPLSPKDEQALEIGLREGIEHIAFSFVRSAADIDVLRERTGGQMKIVAKIECQEALENLDGIIEAADYLLIDRGDLSKEVSIERIPIVQKLILDKARAQDVEVFVATNLLESMVHRRRPTRAEVHDVVATVLDGAAGLTLAAETAVGRHPFECVNMLDRLIRHAEDVARLEARATTRHRRAWSALESSEYFEAAEDSSGLVAPHGGRLVTPSERAVDEGSLQSLARVTVDDRTRANAEQIAFGTYSPLEGFMGADDFSSVNAEMRLANGTPWPVPLILDVPRRAADLVAVGDEIALASSDDEIFAVLHVADKFPHDPDETALALSGTVAAPEQRKLEPILLGGTLTLVRRRDTPSKEYELSPRQVRHLFDERGWLSVVGFHSHTGMPRRSDFLRLQRVLEGICDGALVQPLIDQGLRTRAEVAARARAWETRTRRTLGAAVFAVSPGAPSPLDRRHVLLAAICRKNFGCSHLLVDPDTLGQVGADRGGDYPRQLARQLETLEMILVLPQRSRAAGRRRAVRAEPNPGARAARDAGR